MTNTPRSLFQRAMLETGMRIARSYGLPADKQQAFAQTFPSVAEGVLRELFAGEQLRLYVPHADRAARSARNARIDAALVTGEAVATIAGRERVTVRWVRKRREILVARGTLAP